MANWRIHTLDRAILSAIRGGFNDPDFQGWTTMPADIRIKCVEQILSHNGMENIVYRKSFADALWGRKEIICSLGDHCKCTNVTEPGVLRAGDFHRMNMVISSDYVRYLREHLREVA